MVGVRGSIPLAPTISPLKSLKFFEYTTNRSRRYAQNETCPNARKVGKIREDGEGVFLTCSLCFPLFDGSDASARPDRDRQRRECCRYVGAAAGSDELHQRSGPVVGGEGEIRVRIVAGHRDVGCVLSSMKARLPASDKYAEGATLVISPLARRKGFWRSRRQTTPWRFRNRRWFGALSSPAWRLAGLHRQGGVPVRTLTTGRAPTQDH